MMFSISPERVWAVVPAGQVGEATGQPAGLICPYPPNVFFSRNWPYEISRKRHKIILGIRYDNSNRMDFHEKIAFSTLQDNLQKWTRKSVLQTRKSVLQEYNVL